jgi:hypothetical protein
VVWHFVCGLSASDHDWEYRALTRQERAVPVLERFREWLEEEKPNVLPRSPISGAIGYV